MYIEGIIIGILLAIIFSGRLSNLNLITIKLSLLAVLSSILQILSVIFSYYDKHKMLSQNLFHLSAFTLIILILLNIKLRGFIFILLGALANFTSYILNGFKASVLITNQEIPFYKSIMDNELLNYISIENFNLLNDILGKFISTPSWYPFQKMVSIGDILVFIGIVLFIFGESKRPLYGKKGINLKYNYK
jgi:hypothetical protein